MNTPDPSARGARPPRIAIGGFFLEANRWAPTTGADGFRQGFDAAGDALMAELRSSSTRLLGDSLGFMTAMDQAGDWEPVPLRMAGAEPGGPADHAFFDALCANLDARLKLAELPRNSSKTRIRNRCEVTGRPRAVYRKMKMSRIAVRELGSKGLVPGLVKSSW